MITDQGAHLRLPSDVRICGRPRQEPAPRALPQLEAHVLAAGRPRRGVQGPLRLFGGTILRT